MERIPEHDYEEAFASQRGLFTGPLAGVSPRRVSGSGRLEVYPGGYGFVLVGESRACRDESPCSAYKLFFDVDLDEMCEHYDIIASFMANNARRLRLLRGVNVKVHEHAFVLGRVTVPVVEMPFFPYASLADHFECARAEYWDGGSLAATLLLGLAELEALEASHNDVSPGNLVLRPGGGLLLLDYDNMCVPGLQGLPSLTPGSVASQYGTVLAPSILSPQGDFWGGLCLAVELLLWTPERARSTGSNGKLVDLTQLVDGLERQELSPVAQALCEEWSRRRELTDFYGSILRFLDSTPGVRPQLEALSMRDSSGIGALGRFARSPELISKWCRADFAPCADGQGAEFVPETTPTNDGGGLQSDVKGQAHVSASAPPPHETPKVAPAAAEVGLALRPQHSTDRAPEGTLGRQESAIESAGSPPERRRMIILCALASIVLAGSIAVLLALR